jgi:GAF domain-containing protein
VQLADNLVDEFDVVELVSTLADRCLTILDVSASGLMLSLPSHGLRRVTSSSEPMRRVEEFELQVQEGPSVDCYRNREAVLNCHLGEGGSRWPRFEPVALDGGFRSVHSFPMRFRDGVIGALSLFRADRAEISELDALTAQALADVTTVSILRHRAVLQTDVVHRQLRHALDSRIVIEQAKGALAERAGVAIDAAFVRIRNYARNHNLKVIDVARAIIEGTLTAELDR